MEWSDSELALDRQIIARATHGPWAAHNVDDSFSMNAWVVACNSGSGELDDHGNNVAIVLLQEPRYADVDDGKWRDNAEFIVRARTRWPWLLDRYTEMRERIQALEHENAELRDRNNLGS